MDADRPGLTGEHPSDAGLRDGAAQFVDRGMRAAVVRQGNLESDHFVDQTKVVHDAARQGRGGEGIAARQYPGAQSLLLQAASLHQEVAQAPAGSVGC